MRKMSMLHSLALIRVLSFTQQRKLTDVEMAGRVDDPVRLPLTEAGAAAL